MPNKNTEKPRKRSPKHEAECPAVELHPGKYKPSTSSPPRLIQKSTRLRNGLVFKRLQFATALNPKLLQLTVQRFAIHPQHPGRQRFIPANGLQNVQHVTSFNLFHRHHFSRVAASDINMR